jgi:hypothetical protein
MLLSNTQNLRETKFALSGISYTKDFRKHKNYKMVLKYTEELRKVYKNAIKSFCLTAKVRRWKQWTITIFITSAETNWDEDGERRRCRSFKEGPPLLEVERMHPWRRKIPSAKWSAPDHCRRAQSRSKHSPSLPSLKPSISRPGTSSLTSTTGMRRRRMQIERTRLAAATDLIHGTTGSVTFGSARWSATTRKKPPI